MNKLMALFFAVSALLILFGIGAALSYRNLWAALMLAAAYLLVVGLGFALKAVLKRKHGRNGK